MHCWLLLLVNILYRVNIFGKRKNVKRAASSIAFWIWFSCTKFCDKSKLCKNRHICPSLCTGNSTGKNIELKKQIKNNREKKEKYISADFKHMLRYKYQDSNTFPVSLAILAEFTQHLNTISFSIINLENLDNLTKSSCMIYLY